MATFTVEELTLDVIDALKGRLPNLQRMGKDFRAERLKLDQTYKAKIAGVPTVGDYDASNGGYRNESNDARALLTDLPIVVDKHKHASLHWGHLDSIRDNEQQYQKVVGNAGHALAKEVTLDILSKVNSRNLSQQTIKATNAVDYETINGIRDEMNLLETSGMNRSAIVSTGVASELGLDTRIGSGDFRGEQGTIDRPYRVFRNIAGFEEVTEFPLMPTNNGASVTISGIEADDDTVTTSAAHGLLVGDRITFPTATGGGAGISADGTVYLVATVPTATTFTFSTLAGAAVDVTTDYTGGTVARAENLTGVFFEPEALSILAGIPENFDTFAAEILGAPKPYREWTMTDPDTGLTMVTIAEIEGGTLKGHLHFTLVWGCAVGSQGGADGALTDYYGHRLVSA